jgi:hypothetical protein
MSRISIEGQSNNHPANNNNNNNNKESREGRDKINTLSVWDLAGKVGLKKQTNNRTNKQTNKQITITTIDELRKKQKKLGHLTDLLRGLNDLEIVTKPPDGSTSNSHRAFNGIDGLLRFSELVGNCRQQSVGRKHRLITRVEQHEAACSISVLDLTNMKAAMANQSGLLVTCTL